MTTLKDIAKAADVSITTVSDVLNGKSKERRVSDACSKRVQSIARKLNYKPHIIARGLAQQQTYLIGILTYSMHSSFWGELLQGVINTLEAKDYRVLVSVCTDTASANIACEEMQARQVDGFISSGPIRPAKKYWKQPCVFAHGSIDDKNATWIAVDDESGMRQSVKYLHALNHKHIAVLGTLSARVEFAKNIASEYSMTCIHANFNNILSAVKQKKITAVCCCTDENAIRLSSLLQANGLSIPSDCSIIGYDDLEAAQWVTPALTTIRQPQQSYGKILAETLLQKLNGKKVDSRLLEPKLVVRGSTAQI